jgi:hypothetical protein
MFGSGDSSEEEEYQDIIGSEEEGQDDRFNEMFLEDNASFELQERADIR